MDNAFHDGGALQRGKRSATIFGAPGVSAPTPARRSSLKRRSSRGENLPPAGNGATPFHQGPPAFPGTFLGATPAKATPFGSRQGFGSVNTVGRTPFLASTPSSASWDFSRSASSVSRRFDAALTPVLAQAPGPEGEGDSMISGDSASDRAIESPTFGSPHGRLFSPVAPATERRSTGREEAAKGTPSVLERLHREEPWGATPWGQPPRAPALGAASPWSVASPAPAPAPGQSFLRRGASVSERPDLTAMAPPAKKRIPLPDSEAFNEERASTDSPPGWQGPPQPERPPTPVRSPGSRSFAFQPGVLARFDSLQHTKVLNVGEAAIAGAAVAPSIQTSEAAPRRGAAQLNLPRPPPAPVVFSRDFMNHGTIGQGTSAIVFLCRRKSDGESFAIKRSRKPFKGRTERELLLREVKTLRSIGPHVNLVRLGVAWQEDLFFFTQYEFCCRGTLEDFSQSLEPSPAVLPEASLWRLACDAASALHHVHGAGWVHMDVKPANLLLTQDGVLKLGDFGMTTREGDPGDGAEGDQLYMALELLNCRAVHRSADLFSLGLSFLEVAYDVKLPAEGRKWHEIRAGVFPDVLTAPSEKGCPHPRSEQWQDFVRSLLHPTPAQRPNLGIVVLAHPTMQEALALRRQSVEDEFIQRQALPAWQQEAQGLNRFARAPSYEDHMMQL